MMRILSLGAGVQSSTLALMAAKGEVEPFDHAIFADTQAEPNSVYSWLSFLEKQLPFPVHRVTAGDLWAHSTRVRTSKKTGNRYVRLLVPAYFDTGKVTASGAIKRGLLGRKCTAEYKVRALIRKQRELAGVPRGCKTVMVKTAIGISLDEYHRMKPSQEAWCENYWPLIDAKMTREDCLLWMQRNGYPRPPRSACVFCPFHSDAEWTRLRDEEPEEFARAVQFDEELRQAAAQSTGTAKLGGDVFVHASLKPLSEVAFKGIPVRHQVDLFGNECTGLCGV